MDNQQIIQNFYKAFAAADAERMVSHYADDIRFIDPAFGLLIGEDAKNMWRMLLKNPGINITLNSAAADSDTGSADWTAVYKFSRTGRLVTNEVTAKFKFQNGKIIDHTDNFDIWKWSRQAMGLPGYILGWSSFMKGKVRRQALLALRKFNNPK